MSENQRIRVVLADDHPVVLQGLTSLLEDRDDMEVVAAVRNGREAVNAVVDVHPEVAVLDIRMPGGDGLEATRRIVQNSPETKVIVLSGADEASSALEAFKAGAIGFLPKASMGKFLIDSIRMAAKGQAIMTLDTVTEVVKSVERDSEPSALTEREGEMIRRIADGQTNEQIAKALGVSVSTAKAYLTELFQKIGASDRASAVAICFRRGWLS